MSWRLPKRMAARAMHGRLLRAEMPITIPAAVAETAIPAAVVETGIPAAVVETLAVAVETPAAVVVIPAAAVAVAIPAVEEVATNRLLPYCCQRQRIDLYL